MAERLLGEHQALCVVNTKKRAQHLYQRLKGDGVFHLSTTMYPNHRRRVLKLIRSRLKQGETCILISTSLVEAGVDLDFETCTPDRRCRFYDPGSRKMQQGRKTAAPG